MREEDIREDKRNTNLSLAGGLQTRASIRMCVHPNVRRDMYLSSPRASIDDRLSIVIRHYLDLYVLGLSDWESDYRCDLFSFSL